MIFNEIFIKRNFLLTFHNLLCSLYILNYINNNIMFFMDNNLAFLFYIISFFVW